MKFRPDGSVQSSNTPAYGNTGIPRDDYALYRAMVTKVLYVDDPANVTKNSQNPEVVYEIVILGGPAAGQIISNVRKSSSLGGNENYSEIILKATTKDLSKVRLSQHDGDIVYIQFNQGHDGYPIIMRLGKGISNKTGAKKSEGPRLKESYNNVTKEINKSGEYSVSKGDESSISMTAGETVQMKTKSSGKVKIVKNKIAIGAGSTELLQQIVDELTAIENWAKNIGATHKHIDSLGYPTQPPQEAADYTALGNQLASIKGKINGIKGSL